MMNGDGKSDDPIVPKKSANKGRGSSRPAEPMEERGSTRGKTQSQTRDRTQGRSSLQQAAMRIREYAQRQPQEKFTALWHHVYNPDHLEEALSGLKPAAAPGVDGMTWNHYVDGWEERIADLSDRLRRGACRAKPTQRVYIPVRYADDFVVGFEHRHEAERFLQELNERFESFNLMLHPEKTRLIEFGRFAADRRKRRGEGKPETFDFLGFTHICGKSRGGNFKVLRKTAGKRLKRKLQEIHQGLKRRMHDAIPESGKWPGRVPVGYFRYFGVPDNLPGLKAMRNHVRTCWRRVLSRRSDKGQVSPARMSRLAAIYLPTPQIYHERPMRRFSRRTQGRSPVR